MKTFVTMVVVSCFAVSPAFAGLVISHSEPEIDVLQFEKSSDGKGFSVRFCHFKEVGDIQKPNESKADEKVFVTANGNSCVLLNEKPIREDQLGFAQDDVVQALYSEVVVHDRGGSNSVRQAADELKFLSVGTWSQLSKPIQPGVEPKDNLHQIEESKMAVLLSHIDAMTGWKSREKSARIDSLIGLPRCQRAIALYEKLSEKVVSESRKPVALKREEHRLIEEAVLDEFGVSAPDQLEAKTLTSCRKKLHAIRRTVEIVEDLASSGKINKNLLQDIEDVRPLDLIFESEPAESFSDSAR